MLNGRGFDEALGARWPERVATPLATVVIGIDGDVTDERRREVAQYLETRVLAPHQLATLDPRTFAVLFVGLDLDGAVGYAGMILAGFADGDGPAVVATAGVAAGRAGDHDPAEVLARAQAARAEAPAGEVRARKHARRGPPAA